MSKIHLMVRDIYEKRGGDLSGDNLLKELNEKIDKKNFNKINNYLTTGAAVMGAGIAAAAGIAMVGTGAPIFVAALGAAGVLAPISLAVKSSHDSRQYGFNTNNFASKLVNKVATYFSGNRSDAVKDVVMGLSDRIGQPIKRDQVFDRTIENYEDLSKQALKQFENGSTYKNTPVGSSFGLPINKARAKHDSEAINMSDEMREKLSNMVSSLHKTYGKHPVPEEEVAEVLVRLELSGISKDGSLDKHDLDCIKENRIYKNKNITEDAGLAHSM